MKEIKIGTFVPQYKGKDLGKIPKSKLKDGCDDVYLYGIKYDGNYIQIHKDNDKVWIFTSSGIQMSIIEIEEAARKLPMKQFIIEAEFCNTNQGLRLLDRNQSSTGKARADFKKGLSTSYPNCNVMIFDILYSDIGDLRCRPRYFRQLILDTNTFGYNQLAVVEFMRGTLSKAKKFARELINNNGEGAFAYNQEHTISDKGRSNLAIKIKAGERAYMLCCGAKVSDTVDGEWGALELVDSIGHRQMFGGLPDKLRKMYPEFPKDKQFTVKYESVKNGIYIQGFIVNG